MRDLISSAAAIAIAAGSCSFAGTAYAQEAAPDSTKSPVVGSAQAQTAGAPVGATVNHRNSVGANSNTSGEIIVTARKREESLQNTPIAITAFGDKFLKQNHVQSVDDLTTFVPGLLNFERPGYQASGIYLRGIGTTIESALAEGSVSVVVDGIQVPGYLQRAAGFDLARIEVLRGPQALFYGKGTPAGVISMIGAAPTNDFEVSANAGYEFDAHEKYGELIISGPLSDALSARIGARYSTMDGYYNLRTLVIPDLTSPLPENREPNKDDLTVRAAIKWQPTDRFNATVTGLYFHLRQNYGVNEQPIYCPNGTRNPAGPLGGNFPGLDQIEDCKANTTTVFAPIPAIVLAIDPHMENSPMGLSYNNSFFGTATANYKLNSQLTLSSVTGYLTTRSGNDASFSMLPTPNFTSSQWNNSSQLSEEVRLNSSYEGPINFLAGAFYEYSDVEFDQRVQITAPDGHGGFILVGPLGAYPNAAQLDEDVRQKRNFYSLFGQIIAKPIESVEIDAGGRWSHDQKRAVYSAPLSAPGASRPLEKSFNDFSPEVTMQYKPNDNVNLYGSYKQGFKSGGLSGATFRIITFATDPNADVASMSYDPEKVRGFELGSKLHLGRLRLNAAAFTYNYEGLQLSSFDPLLAQFTIRNAGVARVKGLEGDFTYSPEFMRGFTAFGSVGYVKARYTSFLAPCYDGQSISEGCNLIPVNGNFTSQDLSGAQLRGAPDWTMTAGFNYETMATERFGVGISGDMAYTSSYPVILTNQPGARQPATTKFNATIHVFTADRRWDLALIGRNLTNKFVIQDAFSTFDSGQVAVGYTGTVSGYKGDIGGTVMRGREVRLQLNYRM